MDYYNKCQYILKKLCNVKKFDTSFIYNILDYYDKKDEFTYGQQEAIDNIIQKWKI